MPPSSGRLSERRCLETCRIYPLLSLPFSPHEDGQGLAEYALILALIAIVAIVALLFLGGQISSILSIIGASL